MDYRRINLVCAALTIMFLVLLMGCHEQMSDEYPIRTEESFLKEFREYLAERGSPNLILTRFKNAEVYCKDNKFIETLGIYEICHSFDDRIHPGDILMRRSHFEGKEQNFYCWNLWANESPCCRKEALLDFFPLKDEDIEFIKEERLMPNDPNTKRRLYYVRDLIPVTLSNLYPIVSTQLTTKQKKSFANAISAYFVIREEYRNKKSVAN